jgi:hypothetical protein
LGNALVLSHHQPTVAQMAAIYRMLRSGLSGIVRNAGARSAFEARVFAALIVLGKALTVREPN